MNDFPMVNIAVEGDLDEAVLRKVLGLVGIGIVNIYGKKGKDNLRLNVPRYNAAAQHGGWVVLADLDRNAECPPPFILTWLPSRHPKLQLRIAVRAIEAWLLADRHEIARFLKVSEHRIPLQPEDERNPKATLISIARNSKSKMIREDVVPSPKSTATQGPAYTSRIIEFAMNYWNPERAANSAPSLARSVNSLSRWKIL
jgi:hypothetical protein